MNESHLFHSSKEEIKQKKEKEVRPMTAGEYETEEIMKPLTTGDHF
jgi:hypothetical protein